MSKVLLNFSPFLKDYGANVYQLHVEDISDPDVYARFNIRMPELKVTESGRIDPKLQSSIIKYIKENINVFNESVNLYQFKDVTLDQLISAMP